MDNMKEVSLFLDEITPFLTSGNADDIDSIRLRVDSLIISLGLNKKQLITKWIEVNGEDAFKVLKVETSELYFKVLNIILLSSIEYLNSRNDPLYFIAELSIMSDWYSFRALDI